MLLRIKESEIQYLKQEIHSLKDELQSALRVNRKEGGGRRGCNLHSFTCSRVLIVPFILFPLQDKKYATDKYKDIYTELSIVKAKADCDISKLKEKLLLATEALGERRVDGSDTSGYGNYSLFL